MSRSESLNNQNMLKRPIDWAIDNIDIPTTTSLAIGGGVWAGKSIAEGKVLESVAGTAIAFLFFELAHLRNRRIEKLLKLQTNRIEDLELENNSLRRRANLD